MKYLKLFEEVDAFDLDEDGNNRLEFEDEIGFKRPIWNKEFDLEEIKNILYDIKDIGFHVEIQSRHDVIGTWHEIQDVEIFIDNWLDENKKFSKIEKDCVENVLKQKYLDINIYTRKYSKLNKEEVEDIFFETFDRISEMYDVFYSIYESSDNDFFSFTLSVYNKTKDTQALLDYRKDINQAIVGKKSKKWTLNENIDNTYKTIEEELEDIKFILEDDNIEYSIQTTLPDPDTGVDDEIAKIVLINKNIENRILLTDMESYKEWIDRAEDILNKMNISLIPIHGFAKKIGGINYVIFFLKKPNI